jgi:predicted RNase H-like HicB family nuclease
MDMHMFTFTGLIVKETQAFSSLCPELDVASFGATREEAKAMLLEAATLHIEGAIEDGLPCLRPLPPEADPRYSNPASVTDVFRFKIDVAVHAHA